MPTENDSAKSNESVALPVSLRDYFIAHAPLVPMWFDVEMPEPKPKQHVTAVDGDVVEITDDGPAWERRRSWLIAIQWPIAWADAMLAEREKEQQP